MDTEEFRAAAPATILESDPERPMPTDGIALCLSGGGYRAALFHLGAVWALKRAGVLASIDRISSASGGSFIAALVGAKWDKVIGHDDAAFEKEIVQPIFSLTSHTVDIPTALFGLAKLRWLHDPLVHALERHLFNGATLQSLPDTPRIVINATNVQSGALWRFMKPRMRDWRVGDVPSPQIKLSQAVAASAAFPPFLSPFRMKLQPSDFIVDSGRDLRNKNFRSTIYLTDAGVYDNLAVETAWKKYRTLLVSDAGWPLPPEPKPSTLWLAHTRRAIDIITHQLAQIRQHQIKSSFKEERRSRASAPPGPLARKGAYWGLTSRPESYGVSEYYVASESHLASIRRFPTRLSKVRKPDKEMLVDWGYFMCKLALDRYLDVKISDPPPYSNCSS